MQEISVALKTCRFHPRRPPELSLKLSGLMGMTVTPRAHTRARHIHTHERESFFSYIHMTKCKSWNAKFITHRVINMMLMRERILNIWSDKYLIVCGMSSLYFVYNGTWISIHYFHFIIGFCCSSLSWCLLCLMFAVLHWHPLESVVQTRQTLKHTAYHTLVTWKIPLMTDGLCFMGTSCPSQLSCLYVPYRNVLVQPFY